MRQANSTIKGYLYQFNKSILEILKADGAASIVLEGVIEDIDVNSSFGVSTIQCKYHEDKKYQISSVATPIIEMLCHFCESSYLGKDVSYILYAYFAENVDAIDISSLEDFLFTTKDKEILTKYFHKIFTVDPKILKIANKKKKNQSDKDELIKYYTTDRTKLKLKEPLQSFWGKFLYIKAEQFDVLREQVIKELEELVDRDTAVSLYYPNAFSYVASLSSQENIFDRTITNKEFLDFLSKQKTVLLNRWTLEATDWERLLKQKKEGLRTAFADNPDVRAFVFFADFVEENKCTLIPFIREYLSKYYKKPKLQKKPIFIFDDKDEALLQSILIELYKYQQSVNTGLVGNTFIADAFVHNTNCCSEFVCKMALARNISTDILEQCQVTQLYLIGKNNNPYDSLNYTIESMDIKNVNTLKYLIGLSKNLEV